jgi:uncharacterized protein (TIGR02266 family)
MAPDPNTDEIVARYACATIDDLVAKHALDVSEGGMLLRSSGSMPIGKLVNFELRLSNERVVLTGTGRIAWKRDARDGDRPAGVGVKFVDLDDASRALVDQLLSAKGDAIGEFERPPAPAETARTVMGLGSPFLVDAAAPPEPASSTSPPSADETRGGTMLGVSPVVLTPEERARVGTRLGLAPPVASAGLVLGEQSSATNEIDAGWGDEAKTGKREAAPDPREPPAPVARISQIPTVEVRLSQIPRLLDLAANVAASPEAKAAREADARPPPAVEEPPPKLSRARPQRPRASEIVGAPASIPRRRSWSWVVLLLTVAAFGVYLYLDVPSEDPSNGVPSSVAPPETSTPAVAAKSAAPPPSASPVATTGSSAVSFASSRATPSAAPSAPIAAPDAGKHQAPPPKPSASAKTPHAAPSTTTSAKPRSPTKPPPADDNPY